jgi:hypothetical protein
MNRSGARAAVAALSFVCCTAGMAMDAGADWALKGLAAEPVPYRGVVNRGAAGAAGGGMLYPAPGLVGFAVAVLAHALIVDATKTAEGKRLQEEADRVLQPFQEQLAGFDYPELLRMTLQFMPGDERKTLLGPGETGAGWQVSATPAYAMTQDGQALILDSAVSLFAPGVMDKPAYTGTVRVVSTSAWKEDSGAGSPLRRESARLLAHALQLAMGDARKPAEQGAFRTVRYPEGGSERIERAQVLEQRCGRSVLRTLRGWLLSVPSTSASTTPAACANGEWR